MARFTARQQAFVDAYAGDAKAAAIAAGYSERTAKQAGSRLRQDPQIDAAIRARDEDRNRILRKEAERRVVEKHGEQAARIATRLERQAWWTHVMLGVDENGKPLHEMRDRLKASELLGKSEADFTEKLQHQGDLAINVINPYAEPTE